MDQKGLAFHETMEIHEMINFKTVCMLKSKLMQGACFDSDLKAMMEKDAQQSIHQMNELLELYKGARAF
ncbi:spore coat protein [Domibacillus sp. DTU_2020_1001157_1_SI_ALB_TIR_016]|uniref:spore coat protein n=1 Tax=Domibacillus sp. DTU_2020_1001157_1_SI_ALB_TIR_016 TaxID=3077789 RepID=UPI0028E6D291|nr:spore coat protein [Domibacillus sp. DTU_2020_1001157_1_SI_ALB_TIR_016]WNS79562.1 spore coat protein [Domibacillus sp. DTU_2020_1001157_1_SI_ALB_TIR_016]